MAPFVRFILFILVVGVVVNLTIVLLANTHSQRQQTADEALERARFKDLVDSLSGRLRRADVAVEWQKIDATETVLETSLLVRRYALDADGKSTALPLIRVAIRGGRMHIDGLMLDFDSLFAPNNVDFAVLRNAKLAYFAHVYGEEPDEKQWFSFVNSPEVPELTRLHPDQAYPSFYELHLWQHIWELIKEPDRAAEDGLKVTWTPAAERTVKIGHLYAAYLGNDGVTIEEDDTPGLLREILDQAAKESDKLDGQRRQSGAAPGE